MVTVRSASSNMKKPRILRTDCIYVFRSILGINSDFFLHIIKWLVFVVGTLSVFHEIQS